MAVVGCAEGHRLAAVPNLTFMEGLRSQQAVDVVEAVSVKVVEGTEVNAVSLLAFQEERAAYTLKWRV